jgi:hypothetical protein
MIKERWIQSYFVDQLQYSRWTKEEKQKADQDERHRVKFGGPLGNVLCVTFKEQDAEWIASRLNLADDLEEMAYDLFTGKIDKDVIIKYVSNKLRE